MPWFGVPHRCPFRGSRTKPKKIAATPLRNSGLRKLVFNAPPRRPSDPITLWCRHPAQTRRDRDHRRTENVSDQPSDAPAVCCWVADHHAVARHHPADGGHAVTQSQTTAYPHRGSISVQLRVRSVTSRTVSGNAQAHTPRRRVCVRCKQTPPVPRRRAKSSTVVRVGVGSQAGMSRRQRCSAAVKAKSEAQSEVQLANAALSYGRTTYSHGAVRPCRLGRRRRTRTVGMRLAADSARGGVLARHQERAALPALREAACRTRSVGCGLAGSVGRRRTRIGACGLAGSAGGGVLARVGCGLAGSGRRRTRIRSVRPCRLCGRRRTRTVEMRPCRLCGRRRTRIRRH